MFVKYYFLPGSQQENIFIDVKLDFNKISDEKIAIYCESLRGTHNLFVSSEFKCSFYKRPLYV